MATLEQATAFDAAHYEDPKLKLETIDGRRIDEIVIAFNGSITLNRRDVDDVELYKKLKLGREVEFRISGAVAGDAETIKPATDTKGEQLIGKRTIRVHTIEPVTVPNIEIAH